MYFLSSHFLPTQTEGVTKNPKDGCFSPPSLFLFLAPNEKMKQVIKKTIEEAKAIISKVSFLNDILKLVF